MIIAIDFDGTIVAHCFPEIGAEVPGAFKVMRKMQEKGHKLILYTMRSNKKAVKSDSPDITAVAGRYLTEAVDYCRAKGIEFWGVNENPSQKHWTSSPKVYANIYIDDAALGCPLRYGAGRPFVDWERIETLVLGEKKKDG